MPDILSESVFKHPRLTLGSTSTRRGAPLTATANIPQFTHPSSQSNKLNDFRPLPKPAKEPKAPKTPKARSKASSKSIAEQPEGFVKRITKRQAAKAEEERKKREAPLDEAEEGEYDDHGFWVSSQQMNEWRLGIGAEDEGTSAKSASH